MCEDCRRERTYDWIRDRNGKPKLTPNGSYVMQNENSANYGFTVETLDRVRELLDEIEKRPRIQGAVPIDENNPPRGTPSPTSSDDET